MICLGVSGEDSLIIAYTVECCRDPSVAPSAVLVNINIGVRTINEPDKQISPPADLQEAWVYPHHLEVAVVVAFRTMTEIPLRCHATSWKELSGKFKGGGTMYTVLVPPDVSALPRQLRVIQNVLPVR